MSTEAKSPTARYTGFNRARKGIDFGKANCFDFENSVGAVGCDQVDGAIKATPVFLIDPCQDGQSPLFTQTLLPNSVNINGGLGAASAAYAAVWLGQLGYVGFNGSDPTTTVQAQALPKIGGWHSHTVSAPATAQTIPIAADGINKSLQISMVCSGAGTATLTISVSCDNVAFITIDSIAAAATTLKAYFETTLGATTALSPLPFRFIKIVAGSAGVGNTTTLDVAMK